MAEAEAHRELYLRTEVAIALPAVGWMSATDALQHLSAPVHVLTAWNAGTERPGTELNRERNRALLDALIAHGVEVFPAIGSSPDGDHYEESYAVTGLARSTAVALASDFGQVAIFELGPSTQTVAGCDGTWELSRNLV
jgi:hypothetical protein